MEGGRPVGGQQWEVACETEVGAGGDLQNLLEDYAADALGPLWGSCLPTEVVSVPCASVVDPYHYQQPLFVAFQQCHDISHHRLVLVPFQ